MSIVTVAKTSKLGLLHFVSKLPNGKHINLKSFEAKHAMEAIICPTTRSYFNIDGEIYDDDEAHVKTLPGFLNLMGKTHPLSDAEKEYLKGLDSEEQPN